MTSLPKITDIKAREILDSRGNPPIEVEILLNENTWARAAAPSGASKGVKEACELRDETHQRFHGRGVLHAVSNVNNLIRPRLIGLSCINSRDIDSILIELAVLPTNQNLEPMLLLLLQWQY